MLVIEFKLRKKSKIPGEKWKGNHNVSKSMGVEINEIKIKK